MKPVCSDLGYPNGKWEEDPKSKHGVKASGFSTEHSEPFPLMRLLCDTLSIFPYRGFQLLDSPKGILIPVPAGEQSLHTEIKYIN